MIESNLILPRVGDTWEYKREPGSICGIDAIVRKRGAGEPVVSVIHPMRIVYERKLSIFLRDYRFVRSATMDDVHALLATLAKARGTTWMS